jgi:hypothetical protein
MYIKMQTTHDYGLLAMNEDHQTAYNAWKAEHCVTLYEHYGFKGRARKTCIDPKHPANQYTSRVGYMNDKTSSVKVGKKVRLTLFQHNPHNGWLANYYPGYQGKVHAFMNDQATSLKLTVASKSACVYEHNNLKGRAECFPYNEKTGKFQTNLVPMNLSDKISSVFVPEGVVLQLYQHPNAGGLYDEFWGPTRANVPK